ncbi:Hypothetical predicted protein [Olea europaea subsp. europaea]|uniref:Uncharacterized protein n=1 Tax=Olea europaea subsp. europaea TaxID=158383 RepID=A0A8S0VJ29_OLEEU|nr:Hypothetical predicted protein [Olea europaea subsp. europaea]
MPNGSVFDVSWILQLNLAAATNEAAATVAADVGAGRCSPLMSAPCYGSRRHRTTRLRNNSLFERYVYQEAVSRLCAERPKLWPLAAFLPLLLRLTGNVDEYLVGTVSSARLSGAGRSLVVYAYNVVVVVSSRHQLRQSVAHYNRNRDLAGLSEDSTSLIISNVFPNAFLQSTRTLHGMYSIGFSLEESRTASA